MRTEGFLMRSVGAALMADVRAWCKGRGLDPK